MTRTISYVQTIPVLLNEKNGSSMTYPTRQSLAKTIYSYWKISMEYTTWERSRYKWWDNIQMYYEGTGFVDVHWVHVSQNRVKSQDFVIKVMYLLLHRSRMLTSWETVSLKRKHYHWISYIGCFARPCYENVQWEMPQSHVIFNWMYWSCVLLERRVVGHARTQEIPSLLWMFQVHSRVVSAHTFPRLDRHK
jgi:hypothetical protein